MTRPQPKAFQLRAIEKISNSITTLTKKDSSLDRLVIFKSPTGSGKTLMVASALSDAFQKPTDTKFIVLWLSPSEGKLHSQTAKALSWILEDSAMVVHLLDTREDVVRYQDPEPGTIFVANWDKLRAEKDGEFTNIMVREGETANFFTLLANAASKGLDIITVIDESHRNLGAEKTERLMSTIREMRPFIQLELSATPTRKPDPDLLSDGVHHWIRVSFDEVENAGLVRKSVLLNEKFLDVQARHEDDPLGVQVLWAAWEKALALEEDFAREGSPVKPLLLIQYPDGEKAEARAHVVEKFLSDRGLRKNETYAVWLSKEHSPDLDKIALNSSPYRALIFKQAIATGWDCPRAQVLVQFRDPKSPIFQIQTIGRILRSPEQKHYPNESLNLAYVYSDLEGVSVKVESDEPDAPLRDTELRKRDVYPAGGLALISVFQPRAREFHYPMIENLSSALNLQLDKNISGLLTNEPYTSTPATILTDARVSARELDAGIERDLSGAQAVGNLDEMLVQALYEMTLVASIGQYRSRSQSLSRIKRTISLWFKANRPDWTADEIQHFVLRNQTSVIESVNNACEKAMSVELEQAIAEARGKKRVLLDWEIPAIELVASKESDSAGEGFLYTPALVWKGRSQPEKRFEKWLSEAAASGRVLWWWKNGSGDERYLGVEYSVQARKSDGSHIAEGHITYPDYLVFTSEGRLLVLEVKDVDDFDGALGGKTHSKAIGLAEWAKAVNSKRENEATVFGRCQVEAGVVIPFEFAAGSVSVKVGDPFNWLSPNSSNLSNSASWAELVLSRVT
jgi:type III restriction enzyme